MTQQGSGQRPQQRPPQGQGSQQHRDRGPNSGRPQGGGQNRNQGGGNPRNQGGSPSNRQVNDGNQPPQGGSGRGSRRRGGRNRNRGGGGGGADRDPNRQQQANPNSNRQSNQPRQEREPAPPPSIPKRYAMVLYETFAAARADIETLAAKAKEVDQLNIVIRAEGDMDDVELCKYGKVFAGEAWTLIHERRIADGWYNEPR